MHRCTLLFCHSRCRGKFHAASAARPNSSVQPYRLRETDIAGSANDGSRLGMRALPGAEHAFGFGSRYREGRLAVYGHMEMVVELRGFAPLTPCLQSPVVPNPHGTPTVSPTTAAAPSASSSPRGPGSSSERASPSLVPDQYETSRTYCHHAHHKQE